MPTTQYAWVWGTRQWNGILWSHEKHVYHTILTLHHSQLYTSGLSIISHHSLIYVLYCNPLWYFPLSCKLLQSWNLCFSLHNKIQVQCNEYVKTFLLWCYTTRILEFQWAKVGPCHSYLVISQKQLCHPCWNLHPFYLVFFIGSSRTIQWLNMRVSHCFAIQINSRPG